MVQDLSCMLLFLCKVPQVLDQHVSCRPSVSGAVGDGFGVSVQQGVPVVTEVKLCVTAACPIKCSNDVTVCKHSSVLVSSKEQHLT